MSNSRIYSWSKAAVNACVNNTYLKSLGQEVTSVSIADNMMVGILYGGIALGVSGGNVTQAATTFVTAAFASTIKGALTRAYRPSAQAPEASGQEPHVA